MTVRKSLHRSCWTELTCQGISIVNINKNRSEKNTELILRFINGGFPRYVVNQLNILVPVGQDIKIVTPVK